MTQYNLPVFTSPTPGRTLLKDNLEPWRDAVHSMHAGVTRPDYVVPQMMWIDTSSTPWVLKVFQGSDDIVLGDLDPTTLQFSPSGSVDYNNLTNRPTLGILAARNDASGVPASTANGLISTNAQGQIDELIARFEPVSGIGRPFFVYENLSGVSIPSNAGTQKFIRLTAGQSGSGGYNNGLLSNEVITGSGALLRAQADISVGSLAGETVDLVNSMDVVFRASSSAGVFQQDAFQGHRFQPLTPGRSFATNGPGGSSWAGGGNGHGDATTGDPVTDGVNGVPRTADRTRDKSVSMVAYMRIV